MTMFWVMLARPLLYLIIFAPIVALGVWWARKLPDGKLRRILLWPGRGKRTAADE